MYTLRNVEIHPVSNMLIRIDRLVGRAINFLNNLFELCLEGYDRPVMALRCLAMADRLTETLVVCEPVLVAEPHYHQDQQQQLLDAIATIRHEQSRYNRLNDDSADAILHDLVETVDEIMLLTARR